MESYRRDPVHTAIVLTTRIVPFLLGVAFILIGCIAPPPNLHQTFLFDDRLVYALTYIFAGATNIVAALRKSTWIWPTYIAVPATLVVCAIRSIAIMFNSNSFTWQQQVTGVISWTLIAFLKLAVAFSTISWTAMKREGRI